MSAPEQQPVLIDKVKKREKLEATHTTPEHRERAKEHVRKAAKTHRDELKRHIEEYRAQHAEHVNETHVQEALADVEDEIKKKDEAEAPLPEGPHTPDQFLTPEELKAKHEPEDWLGKIQSFVQNPTVASLVSKATFYMNKLAAMLKGGLAKALKPLGINISTDHVDTFNFLEEQMSETLIRSTIQQKLPPQLALKDTKTDEQAAAVIYREWKNGGRKVMLEKFVEQKVQKFCTDNKTVIESVDSIDRTKAAPVDIKAFAGNRRLILPDRAAFVPRSATPAPRATPTTPAAPTAPSGPAGAPSATPRAPETPPSGLLNGIPEVVNLVGREPMQITIDGTPHIIAFTGSRLVIDGKEFKATAGLGFLSREISLSSVVREGGSIKLTAMGIPISKSESELKAILAKLITGGTYQENILKILPA